MAYGHRSKGNCADIEMLKAPAVLDKVGFQRAVNALQPKGMTPISASVRMAAEQLKFSERKATVILVSDGEETCHADPCALGQELEKLGVDFTAHVIGFDIEKGSKAHAQLQCLATSTGGKYLDARNAEDLNKAMGDVARTVPAPTTPPAKVANPHFNEGCTAYDQENYTGNRLQIAEPLAARCARRLNAGARASSRCTASRAAGFWCLPNRAMTAPTSASPTARSSRACLKTMPSRLAPTRWVVLHKPTKRHGASRAPPIVPFIVAKDHHENCSALQSAVDQPLLCPHIGSGGLR
ncbi:MAG: hypothetical protein LC097_03725 [Burkholderiales bacterium]|nr:hypothetical protein [Burkholderiales bacterium]